MNQKAIIEAIEKQLDGLESVFNWVMLLTIPVIWAGLQQEEEIAALGMTLNLRQGFYILAVAYFFTTLNIYLALRRIGDYVVLLDRKNLLTGISKILLHKWSLNPFGYSGDKTLNRVHNFYGYGGLISAWWLGYTALHTLLGFQAELVSYVFLGLFLIVGLASMQAINRVLSVILGELKELESSLYGKYRATWRDRQIGAFLGILMGGLIFAGAQYMFGRFP
jgi:hypothetical protein